MRELVSSAILTKDRRTPALRNTCERLRCFVQAAANYHSHHANLCELMQHLCELLQFICKPLQRFCKPLQTPARYASGISGSTTSSFDGLDFYMSCLRWAA
ncbi:hypothetical protein AOQ84DRAFT_122684 [Glonium stellatum]|uniref:Uncharacterized protein n=1 Tax=Glonium stellatum TaxID=574774 RepID=A0A8E2FB19_9PEZI|nr:hypothetical protein AOQ84DRAFT_122684 [Glonium stellatum]